MSTKQQTADAQTVRRQMAQVRHELRDDMEGVVENAKELVDWKHYVREYPYACVGVALAVGFLIVPQKISVMSPTAEQLEKLAKRDHLIVKPSPNAGPPSPGWKKKALNFGANLLLRSAVTYLGQRAGDVLGKQQAVEAAGE